MGNDADDSGEQEIMERREIEVRIGAKKFVCGYQIAEEDVLAIKNETWLTGGGERSGRKKRDQRNPGDEIPVKRGVRSVDSFDFFVACSGSAPGAFGRSVF